MKHYEYSLSFSLAKATKTSEECTDLLFEAGCDDAVVGVGAANSIALTFDRHSDTATQQSPRYGSQLRRSLWLLRGQNYWRSSQTL